MTISSQKPKKSVEANCTLLHNKKDVKAFRVVIPEGKFIVIDYKDRASKSPDTEVYWESGTWPLAKHASQYKEVEKTVNAFLKGK